MQRDARTERVLSMMSLPQELHSSGLDVMFAMGIDRMEPSLISAWFNTGN